jgi:putative Mg2+ transporter-C (MgtC) family protein
MDWQLELLFAGRTLGATLLGGIIGLERLFHDSAAGVRTYASVAMGACVFALISQHIPGAAPARMASNIVVGVGFLGAGIIMQVGNKAFGLTTAATIWVTAAIGTAIGFGMYVLGGLATLIVVLILLGHHLSWFRPKSGGTGDPPKSDA